MVRKSLVDWDQVKGTTRKRTYILAGLETKLIRKVAPLVPSWLETYHLTWMALPQSLLILFFSCLARSDIRWLWGATLAIVAHYVTDFLDGEIGRRRDTGLVKWGAYVDHFLDHFFGTSVILSYAIIFPDSYLVFFLLLAVLSGQFIDTGLRCIALGDFITAGHFGIGPTEIYVVIIAVNTFLSLGGKINPTIVFGLGFLALFLPLLNSFYCTQKLLWKADMENKNGKSEEEERSK